MDLAAQQRVLGVLAAAAILVWGARRSQPPRRQESDPEKVAARCVPDLWAIRAELLPGGACVEAGNAGNCAIVAAQISDFAWSSVMSVAEPERADLEDMAAKREACINALQSLTLVARDERMEDAVESALKRFVTNSQRYISMAWRAAGSPAGYLSAARGFPSPWEEGKDCDYRVA